MAISPIQGRWRPQQFPDPQTDEAFRIAYDYLYELKDLHQDNAAAINTVTNSTSNITQQVTAIIAGNSNNGLPPFSFGVHSARLGASPGSYANKGWVETDRNNALYSSDGSQWYLVAGIATGTFENRYTGLNAQDAGFFWIETSRNSVASAVPPPTYRWDGNNWNFQYGAFNRNQSDLATLKTTFSANNSNNGNDLGAVVNVSDYHHQLQWGGYNGTVNSNNTTTVIWASGDTFDSSGAWTGTTINFAGVPYTVASVANSTQLTTTANVATVSGLPYTETKAGKWNWGPQDDLRAGEGPILREVDPSPTTGWQLYAGNNNVTYLKADGNTGTVNLPNLSGTGAGNTAFLEAGEVNSGINAAFAPIFTGNAYTPAGSVTGTATGSYTPAGTISAFFSGTAQTFTTFGVAAGGANNAFILPNPYTPAGNVTGGFTGFAANVNSTLTASFSGTPGSITGTISSNGTPANLVRRAWFRK